MRRALDLSSEPGCAQSHLRSVMRKKLCVPLEASVPSFCFVLMQRGRLSLHEPMHPQRSLDVDAAHEVDVHVRVLVDAFFLLADHQKPAGVKH